MKEKMDKISQKSKIAAQKARAQAQNQTSGFLDFIREQGVITLAVGFILGGAVGKLVASLVTDIINPLLGVLLGKVNLSAGVLVVGPATIAWGKFVTNLIDFVVIALVIYFGFKILRLDRLDIDKKKREKEAEAEAKAEEAQEKQEKKSTKK